MTTRSEGVRLRPFLSIDDVQRIFTAGSFITLRSEVRSDDFESISPIEVFPKAISNLGISWTFKGNFDELIAALKKASVVVENVSVVVRASDRSVGVLRESEIVFTGQLDKLRDTVDIASFGAVRPSRILLNQWTGFRLEAFLILNEELPFSHIRPWMKGTILASDEFEIVPVAEWDSIQPIELTSDIRDKLKVAANVWCHVEFKEEFFESQEMSDALVFYVDKEILAGIKALPENQALLGQTLLVGILIPQITYMAVLAIRSLEEDFLWDGTTGVVLRFLHRSFDSNKKPQDFINMLVDNPEKVSNQLLANNKLAIRLKNTLTTISEGAMDVSNIDDLSS